jgi:hypothetical protein
MNAHDIRQAVDAGQRICWKSEAYEVIRDRLGQYFIRCSMNGHVIGLTWQDGETLNGKAEDFFLADRVG